jgi:toxin ParE1/3/4
MAVADILAQADWYELQSDRKLAKRWERAVTSSILLLVRAPRAGALCGFKAEALRATRRLSVTGFSAHLIFHNFLGNQIHVLRVVHGARDLETLLSE